MTNGAVPAFLNIEQVLSYLLFEALLQEIGTPDSSMSIEHAIDADWELRVKLHVLYN